MAIDKVMLQLLADRAGDAKNRHPQGSVGEGARDGGWGGLNGGQGWEKWIRNLGP